MGTRCGALDPGVVLYLLDEHKMDARAIERLLYHESGLLGVSEIGGDMRTARSWPATTGAPQRPSTFSSIASAENSAHWPPRWAGWTPSSSPAASASMPRRSAPASARTRPGSASS
jgi:hypothetical protein